MFSSPLFCDTCGAANRPQANFCASCGGRLHAAVQKATSNTLTGFLVPSHMLNRRYRVLGQAGKGGFGAVYKAEDTLFGGRLVAVKEMSQSNLNAQDLAEATLAFQQEALLLACLRHPNLPGIYDQFSDAGRWYLVMDYIDGKTLEDILEQQNVGGTSTGLAIEKALDIAIQACSVLEYLHTRQPPIIFRDLKPANIMLTASGHVYLIDFGIARHFKPGQVKDTAALGSTGYAAPEQYGKSQTTERTDIYGLGATLHQMLSGQDPSLSPFQFAPLSLPPLPALAPLAGLVKQMVEVPVNKRPASVSLVRQQLQEIVNQYRQVASTNPLMTHSMSLQGIKATGSSSVSPPPGYKAPAAMRTVATPQPQQNTLFLCKGHGSRITAVAWSPDGRYLASASYDKTVRIWNSQNGSPFLTYRGHAQRVQAVAWSPQSPLLASASDDGTVQIWETSTGNISLIYRGHSSQVNAIAWSPDGRYLASCDEGKTVQVWQRTSSIPLFMQHNRSEPARVLAWSPNSRSLAFNDAKTIHVCDPLKGQRSGFWTNLLNTLRGQVNYTGHRGRVSTLAWSPDGRFIASGGYDKIVQVWDVTSSKRTFFYDNHTANLTAVAWSPDGSRLAFGSNDKTVQVWDLAARKVLQIYRGHSHYITSLAWSPDGSRIASASVDRTLQVWTV